MSQRVLAIGISQYADGRSVPHAVLDAGVVFELLTRDLNFDERGSSLLVNEAATRSRIMSEIAAIRDARSSDCYVIYYAGLTRHRLDAFSTRTDLVPYDASELALVDHPLAENRPDTTVELVVLQTATLLSKARDVLTVIDAPAAVPDRGPLGVDSDPESARGGQVEPGDRGRGLVTTFDWSEARSSSLEVNQSEFVRQLLKEVLYVPGSDPETAGTNAVVLAGRVVAGIRNETARQSPTYSRSVRGAGGLWFERQEARADFITLVEEDDVLDDVREARAVSLSSEPGMLMVRVEPIDARATLGGTAVPVGRPFETPSDLSRLIVSHPGYRDYGTYIRVVAEETTYVDVVLEPATAGLRITNIPSGTTAFVDGEQVETDARVSIRSGWRQIEVRDGRTRLARMAWALAPDGEYVVELAAGRTLRPAFLSMIVPGLGQQRANARTKGIALSAAFLAGGVAVALSHGVYRSRLNDLIAAQSAYDAAVGEADVVAMRTRLATAHDRATAAFDRRYRAAGITGGIWLIGVLDAAVFSSRIDVLRLVRAEEARVSIHVVPGSDLVSGRPALSIRIGL